MTLGHDRWKVISLYAVVVIGLSWLIYTMARPVDEIVLTIGEPYEQVRKRSSSTLPPAVTDGSWGGLVNRPAKLRFDDAQFGFVTPPAKFFAVMYDKYGNVSSLRLSPQIKTLLLDDAMAIVADLQDQFERGGWRVAHVSGPTARLDSLETRDVLMAGRAPTTRWQAGDKYEVSLNIHRFGAEKRPDKARFLITMSLSDVVFGKKSSDQN